MNLLEITAISKKINGENVLSDIGLSLPAFEKVAIMGETGSGKSSLLKIIAGLLQPDAGQVIFDQEVVKGPQEKLVPGHPQIAYLSQHFDLPKSLKVRQILSYSNNLTTDEASRIHALTRIDHLLERRTDELSGGEKQRVALARLMTGSPRLLLLDEPFSNLDMAHKTLLKTVVQELSQQMDITCLIVSHDPLDVLPWADTIIILKAGKILQQGSPETVYRKPANEYAASLLGEYNILNPAVAKFFKQKLKLPASKGKLVIRPEDIKITRNGASLLTGVIEDVEFMGASLQLKVKVLKSILTVQTKSSGFAVGEKVHITAPRKAFCEI